MMGLEARWHRRRELSLARLRIFQVSKNARILQD